MGAQADDLMILAGQATWPPKDAGGELTPRMMEGPAQ